MARSGRDEFTPTGLLTLTTDFGERDGYVGAMKGVMLCIEPSLRLVDVAHDLPPQDLRHAALVLRATCPHFPRGTVHLAVVDPGVGGARAPIAVLAGGHALVGPDNGVLSLAAAALGGIAAARRIERGPALRDVLPASRSATFHGRDVFAPLAAALAAGRVEFGAAGPAHRRPQVLALPRPRRLAGVSCGEVTHFDGFGNAITNLPAAALRTPRARLAVELAGGERLRVVGTYEDAGRGELVALVGSEGLMELAVRDGSARARARLAAGAPVRVVGAPRGAPGRRRRRT